LDLIDDRPGLARWEAEVRRDFKLVPWSTTADVLLSRFGLPTMAELEAGETPPPQLLASQAR